MSGHIRRRGAHSWELKFELGPRDAGGKRRRRFVSFRGTKRAAEIELVRLIAESKGSVDVTTVKHDHNLDRATSIARKWLSFERAGITPTCFLYRHYDVRGDLLYVGMTLFVLARQMQHQAKALWANNVFQTLIEPFTSRDELITAEMIAIKSEFPSFNQVYNDRTLQRELAQGEVQ
jgi:hypothetical protein